jgi:chromatin remodeling complex protein RSC6
MQWGVKSLIYEYINEKNIYHPKGKRKFILDDKLFPIFKKKVVSKYQIYPLLESHTAKKIR